MPILWSSSFARLGTAFAGLIERPLPLSALDRFSGVFAGIVDGLCDPKRRRRTAFALILAYAAAWLLYGVVAKSSQDINADMAEMVVWAREPALGYPKHPPLLAFVIKLWFSVFPLADWSFTLLAVLTVSIGIFIAIELCGVWLDGEKRAAVPFLLAVIPFYNFLGLKFDQNSALIPLWGLAMWALMRSLATPQQIGWAATAALAAAAAMLTKYWSAFLVAAMVLAALVDRRRDAYWRSKAPWVSALVLLLVVLPHGIWLIRENFPPLTWITTRRAAHSSLEFLHSLGVYIAGTVGYAAAAILLVAFLIHPSLAAVRDSWFARDPVRRPATVLFWIPLLLPIVAAVALHTNLQSVWNGPALNLLPVMMLASPLVAVPRLAVVRIAAIVTMLTVAIVVSSPLVAFAMLNSGVENDAVYARLAAASVEREWRETSDAPLHLVAGPFALASSAAFYIDSAPSTYADFSHYLSPWVSDARIAHDGIAIICAADDDFCLDKMKALIAASPNSRRREVTLQRHWLGFTGEPKRFVVAAVPPRP